MKNINKFFMISLLTSVSFVNCSTTTTPTVITSATLTKTDGTTKGFKIKLNSAGTAYNIEQGGSDNVWTNTLTTPVQLKYQLGTQSSPGTKGNTQLAAGATTTMTGGLYTATVSQAGNDATKSTTTVGVGGGTSAGSSSGVGGGASAGGLAAAKQSKTTNTGS